MYEPVKQPYIPIPPALLSECPVPLLPEKMTFGDSVDLNIRLLDSIDECNGHLRAIQAIEKNRASQ
ncbi:Rz1-like lysis system protein LysC [Kosakonia sacchari]